MVYSDRMDGLHVQAHAADEGGCGHYRVAWPAQAVNQADLGMHVELVHDGSLQVSVAELPDGTSQVVEASIDADVLVLQRPLQYQLAQAIPLLQRNGTAVVVELDDDFQAIHHQNTAWLGVQPKHSPDRNWKWLKQACAQADLVTVTTPNLARKYGVGGNARILPNYVLAEHVTGKPLRHPRGHRPVRFTWTGSVATHPTDLQQAAAGFQQLCREGGPGEAHVVGTGKGVASRLGLGNDKVQQYVPGDEPDTVASITVDNPLVHATGDWVPIEQYPATLRKATDVGVVPLDDIPFNRGKSWLKGLEFAAQGRPFVASATEPYQLLHDEYGLGLIARRPRDWVKHMRRLVDNPDMAEELAATGLATVRDHLTYEENAWRWAAVWAEAAAGRKASRHTVTMPEPVYKQGGLVPYSEEVARG